MKDLNGIMCFELNTVEKYNVLKRRFSSQLKTKATLAILLERKIEKKKEQKMGG